MEAEEEELDVIEREKAIVDQADPAPPEDRPHGHTAATAIAGTERHKSLRNSAVWPADPIGLHIVERYGSQTEVAERPVSSRSQLLCEQ